MDSRLRGDDIYGRVGIVTKTLGTAKGKRKYDLPLHKSEGTGFMVLLVGLMVFLAILSLAASFALAEVTERWSSGLENKVTVEIPAEDPSGTTLSADKVNALTERIGGILQNIPSVSSVHILGEEEIEAMVSPWLGEGLVLDDIPLPGLISVELIESGPETIAELEGKIKAVASQARLDTHESWLGDLLRFTGAMQFAAALLVLVIGLTTITAAAGAVRSRMAVHKAEVELLHLMGASDHYVMRQFQRHSMLLALQGGIAGTVAGGLAILVIDWISGEIGVALLPDFTLNAVQLAILAVMPVIVAMIASLTARVTVLRTLEQLP